MQRQKHTGKQTDTVMRMREKKRNNQMIRRVAAVLFVLAFFIYGGCTAEQTAPGTTAYEIEIVTTEHSDHRTEEATTEAAGPQTEEATAEETTPQTEEATAEGTTPQTEEATAEETTPQTEEATAEEVRSYKFKNKYRLQDHYEKHGIEMGFASAKAYEKAASDVVNNPSALHKTEAEDGDDVYYVEETNEFVVVSPEGYLRTYFCPNDGIKYYERQ